MSGILKKRITIALLIDWLNTPYHQEILSGVADISEKNDINLICFAGGRLAAPNEWENKRNIIFNFIEHERISGLVVAAPSLANYTGNKAIENLLSRFRDMPVVNLGENIFDIPSVGIDNESGTRDVMKHMVEFHGYKRIAFISGLTVNTEANIRLRTYCKMLDYYGLPYDPDLVVDGDFSINSGKSAIKVLLDKRKAKIDAIVSANDYMALGIIDELRIRGRVSSDLIPVAGFDDIDDSICSRLTTVRQPTKRQSALATELLIKRIRGENIPLINSLPAKIVIRESCGCYPNKIFYSVSNQDSCNNDSLENNKDAVISELKRTGIRPESQEILIESLILALNREQPSVFLSAWNDIILNSFESYEKLFDLNTLLSILRINALCFIYKRETLNKAEDMFHEARMMISSGLQKSALFLKMSETSQIERLNDFGAELSNTFDLERQLEIILSRLKALGINDCCISLYNDPEKPEQEARLVFGLYDGKRIAVPKGGFNYKPGEIFPAGIIPDDKRYTYIMENMLRGTTQLGFMLMKYSPINYRIYEMVRTKINISMMSAIMFEKIQKQSEILVRQVREKTSEYYMMKFMKDKVENEVEKLTIHISQRKEKKLDEKSTLVYKSRQLQQVVNEVGQAVMLSKPIFITGETGTGKELIVKLIHYTSGNKDHPFVAINCAAVTHDLWESELFGHVRGSFTDAKENRGGSIAAAGKGTLFLDEICEMPLDIQSKLLRVLQDNQYKPVGSDMFINSKCRFVFATNRDVKQMVGKGEFREDLYYRINVFNINIPPLRERKDDIPVLIDHFIKKYYCEFNLPADLELEINALRKIMNYEWPGNVRELENFIIRSFAILASSPDDKRELKPSHFPAGIISESSQYKTEEEIKPPNNSHEIWINRNYEDLLNSYSKNIILWALKESRGNKTAAAELMGIKRTTLIYKLKELNIAS